MENRISYLFEIPLFQPYLPDKKKLDMLDF